MPRRIVLLSDGTGNSSASFRRTLMSGGCFCALDLSSNDQVGLLRRWRRRLFLSNFSWPFGRCFSESACAAT